MPAFGSVSGTPLTELQAVNAQVLINSVLYPWASVLRLQKTQGIVPSEATIRFSLNQADDSPTTLNRYVTASSGGDVELLQFGSRVVIMVEYTPIFSGHLMRRQDSARDDSVIWTAVDDRDLLAAVPVRGALVYDEVWKAPKFCSAFTPRTNPQGAWNCTYTRMTIKQKQYSGNAVQWVDKSVVVPVFMPYAKHVAVYETPNAFYSGEGTAGSFCAWTPRRWLQYLCALVNLVPTADNDGNPIIEGVNYETWRGIGECGYLQWRYGSLYSLRGMDAAMVGLDPLDLKLADINFQGLTALSALERGLEAAGTHNFTIEPMDGRPLNGEVVGEISFFPVGWSGFTNTYSSQKIQLQRAGALVDAETCVDFDVQMTAAQVRDCALVEGDVTRLEARLTCNVNTDGTINSNSTLVPAWTLTSVADQQAGVLSQQAGFLACIHGVSLAIANNEDPGATGADGKKGYAIYPPEITTGDPPSLSNWLVADGIGGRPLAYAHSQEAIALARQMFPTVFRAFYVKSAIDDETGTGLLTLLEGYQSQFLDKSKYPVLNWKRNILPSQLQYQTSNQGAATQEEINWLLTRYPIRVEVYRKEDEYSATLGWHDIGQQAGWYMSGDGLLWCETLGERVFPSYDSIINPNQSSAGDGGDKWRRPGYYKLRSFRINAAMPMDHRVYGYKNNPKKSVLEDKYCNTLGGPRMLYVDSPEGFKEHHQVVSYPAALVNGGASLSRILASGNERLHAKYAAERKLALSNRVATTSAWRFAGIRSDWKIGDWIEEVNLYSPDGTWVERPFKIQAPVAFITYDFANQKTEVGGLWSTLGGM